MELPGYKLRTKGNARQILLAAQAINESEQPVLYVGGGVILSGASEELRILGIGARPAALNVVNTQLIKFTSNV
jgi:thiamine pyrophosphate-dependent acetolactate synthase large subunit-like protein